MRFVDVPGFARHVFDRFTHALIAFKSS